MTHRENIKNVDRESFLALDTGIMTEWSGIRYHGYGKDKKHIYFHDAMYGRAPKINCDYDSFKSLGNGFGLDNKVVFFNKWRLANADSKTWAYLGNGYSKDQHNVYFYNVRIEDVAVNTFKVIRDAAGNFATDGTKYLHNRDLISEDQLVEIFLTSYHLGHTRKNLY